MEEITRQEEIALHDLLVAEVKKFQLLTPAFVMDLDSYKVCRRILGGQEEDPAEPWVPVQGDMIQGYPLVVREDGGEPHVELVDRPMRAPQFAGVTSLGVEKDLQEPLVFESIEELLNSEAANEEVVDPRSEVEVPAKEEPPEPEDDDAFLDAP